MWAGAALRHQHWTYTLYVQYMTTCIVAGFWKSLPRQKPLNSDDILCVSSCQLSKVLAARSQPRDSRDSSTHTRFPCEVFYSSFRRWCVPVNSTELSTKGIAVETGIVCRTGVRGAPPLFDTITITFCIFTCLTTYSIFGKTLVCADELK